MKMDKLKWYERSGNEGDIVISTRARLARNLKDFPFPGRMDREQQKSVLERLSGVLCSSAGGKEFSLTDLSEASPTQIMSLVERHLISPQMAQSSGTRGVVLSRDESVSVMICEEDHLRIQSLMPGLCIWECLNEAESVDKLIEGSVEYAFDSKLGYLTHCPTNIGTGLRLSVMLHLPALTGTGMIRAIIEQAAKLGFAVRGLYGEGSKASGNIYQVSNQITLGLSELEIARQLEGTVNDLISRERTARERLLKNDAKGLEDRVWRAYGLLGSARRISSSEAMSLVGDLRLGASLKLIGGVSFGDLNGLMTNIQPALLAEISGRELNGHERDEIRAEMIRSKFKL